MELNIGAHSKEQEQLGHVKVKGSQPRNLHFALSEEKYVHTVEKLAYQNVNKKMGKLGGQRGEAEKVWKETDTIKKIETNKSSKK